MKIQMPFLESPEAEEGEDPSKVSSNKNFRLPPGILLSLAICIILLCYAASVFFMTTGPWLGVELKPHAQGIEVVSVVTRGPNEGLLKTGDILTALRTTDDTLLKLTGNSLSMSIYFHGTYEAFNQFFTHYSQLFKAVKTTPITLTLVDGSEITVNADPTRPINSFSLVFWLMTSLGILVFLVGIGVWVFRPNQIATRLVATSAVGYMFSTLTVAVLTQREWLLPPELFFWLSQVSRVGNLVYGFSAMALFWYFPRPLGNFPVATAFFLSIALILGNETFQLIEWPLHTFTTPYFFVFIIGISFSVQQLINTRDAPADRAALLWFIRSTLLSITIVMAIYFGPLLFNSNPLLPPWGAQIVVLGLYIGVVLGVLRFRLFELDRWWFAIWAWLLGGLLVILVDFAVVYFTDLQPVSALPLSMLAIGWVYFPVRQWLWAKLVNSPSRRLEILLPQLLETLFMAKDSKNIPYQWRKLLIKMLNPLHTHTVDGILDGVRIKENGMVIAVPDIQPNQYVLLSGRSRGKRLFSTDDKKLVSFAHLLLCKAAEIKKAQEESVAIERDRITRDLHDDVAPQLLTLIHHACTQENALRARTALQTLRESIYSLSDPVGLPLETVLANWRIEQSERVEITGARLSWIQATIHSGLILTARQHLNLTRILREVTSNALYHAEPKSIDILIKLEKSHQLSIQLTHDGNIKPPQEWRAGKGLNNIRTRITELGGKIEWGLLEQNTPVLVIHWEIPLLSLEA